MEKKDNGIDEDIVLDGFILLKVIERVKVMLKISIKVVKNELKRLILVLFECSGILIKLLIGYIFELC